MYHTTDRHLMRPIVDLDSGHPYEWKHICQDCDEKERNCMDNYNCGGSMCRNGCSSMLNFDEPCAHFTGETLK